ncbi:MAG: helix-hairpin-helix domain-containing protein [Patescibacteria group bacterium]
MPKKKELPINLSNTFSSKVDDFFYKYRYLVFLFLLGIIFVLLGIFISKSFSFGKNKIEIINGNENGDGLSEIVVEIAGEVIKPGVYKLSDGSRIEDLLVLSGGISQNADRNWMEKSLNRAAKLSDGQKVYIPSVDEQSNVLSASDGGTYQNTSSDFGSQGSGFIDVNQATQKELESLSGIGPVYAQRIIEYRPYSNIEEIVAKTQIPQKTFDKIKSQLIVY